MKKLLLLIALLTPLAWSTGCVGQKDDPEEEPQDNTDPQTEFDESEAGRCLVLDFTGTWCVNCPAMHTAIESAMEQAPDIIVPVAVHCLQLDPMSVPICDDLALRFGVNAYPSVVVDLEPGTLFTTASPELLLARCEQLRKARGKAATLEMEGLVEHQTDLKITVSATAQRDGDYTLHLLRLQDGIVSPQTGASENYVHNDVLCEWLDAPESFNGLHAGDSFSATFNFDISQGYVKVVALVCRGGIADNAKGEAFGYMDL